MAVLSWREVAAVALAGGFPPGAAVIAAAITQPEAGRDPGAVQRGQPYATTGWGLWQITPGNSVPRFGIDRALLRPVANARAAHWKWAQAGGFSPWTTFENGLERPYIAAAETAVASLRHLSKKQIDALAAAAAAGGGAGATIGADIADWSPKVAASAGAVGRSARSLHGYAHGTARLHPRFPTPRVRVPAPGTVLWTPQHQERP